MSYEFCSNFHWRRCGHHLSPERPCPSDFRALMMRRCGVHSPFFGNTSHLIPISPNVTIEPKSTIMGVNNELISSTQLWCSLFIQIWSIFITKESCLDSISCQWQNYKLWVRESVSDNFEKNPRILLDINHVILRMTSSFSKDFESWKFEFSIRLLPFSSQSAATPWKNGAFIVITFNNNFMRTF